MPKPIYRMPKFWIGAVLMCLAVTIGIALETIFKFPMSIWVVAFMALFIPGFWLLGTGVMHE